VYAIRSLSILALLLAMASVAWTNWDLTRQPTFGAHAQLGEYYFYAIIGVELAIVMLASPAATAGAICTDRASGTLSHILITDLTDREIVLGKLGARLLPVLGIVACSWPVLAVGSLLGGIDPIALTLAFAIIVAVGLLGCAAALCLSIWAKKPHEVVMAIYTLWALVLLAYPIGLGMSRLAKLPAPPRWVLQADPFYLAFAPYVVPGQTGAWVYVGFFGAVLGTTGALALLAIRRFRAVTVRESSRGENARRLSVLGRAVRMLPRPSLDANPVLWREWHRSRPSVWMAILVGLVAGTTTFLCVAGAVTIAVKGLGPPGSNPWVFGAIYAYMLQLLFGLHMLATVAPLSLAEERQRGSLDVLLASPLSTWSIVWGKWLGTYRLVPLLVIGPALVALAMATSAESMWPAGFSRGDMLSRDERLFGVVLLVITILVHGAAVTSLGLWLATRIKRQSRAVALCVGTLVLLAIGWPILVMVLTKRPGGAGEALASGSPIFMAGELSDALTFRHSRFRAVLWSGVIWAIVVAIAAAGLLARTVGDFDRCLGRMPEEGRVPLFLRKKTEPSWDELADGD
jgi:ABC-type transport system involved in multi-copper enzyme maturation permease subunit